MKKLLIVAMCVVMLFTFVACSGTQFLSQSKVDRLVEKYSTNGNLPQMEMTLSYKTYSNSTPMKVKVTYDLLLDKTPISVMSFIKMLADGRYDGAVVDEKNSSSKHFGIGRFSCVDFDKKEYKFLPTDKTFIGEFASNGLPAYGTIAEGDDGFAKCEIFSLAMYHDIPTSKSDEDEQQAEYARAFNSANGRLILAYSKDALNYKNYAIFARPVSYSVSTNGGDFTNPIASLPSDILTQLTKITSRTVSIDGSTYSPYQIDVSFAMVKAGNIDWSNVSENYLVDAE